MHALPKEDVTVPSTGCIRGRVAATHVRVIAILLVSFLTAFPERLAASDSSSRVASMTAVLRPATDLPGHHHVAGRAVRSSRRRRWEPCDAR